MKYSRKSSGTLETHTGRKIDTFLQLRLHNRRWEIYHVRQLNFQIHNLHLRYNKFREINWTLTKYQNNFNNTPRPVVKIGTHQTVKRSKAPRAPIDRVKITTKKRITAFSVPRGIPILKNDVRRRTRSCMGACHFQKIKYNKRRKENILEEERWEHSRPQLECGRCA